MVHRKILYQATDIVGNLITDINLMLTDGDESGMTFLYRVKIIQYNNQVGVWMCSPDFF